MVSSGQINGDWNSIKIVLDTYQKEVDSLDNGWKGPSHDSLVQKTHSFLGEYTGTIGEEMSAFAYACDLYKNYKITKSNIEITRRNYNAAVRGKDKLNASKFASQLNSLRKELNDLKDKIETNLQVASSSKLTATNTNTSNISIPTSEEFLKAGVIDNPEKIGTVNMGSQLVSSVRRSVSAASSYSGGGTTSSGGTISPSTGSTTSIDYGNLDMTNYPKGSSKEDGLARAVLVAKYLIENGGFTKEQAAAIVGVYLDENNCDPGSYMAAEKNGRGASGTGGNGYGAGIASWTFAGFKNQCLSDAGYPANTPIESLSLQQQCDMVIAMSQKSNKKYYDALKRCNTIEDASATAVIITGGVGYSNHWSTHPTQAEAKAMSDKYGRANDARFGRSSYHWNLDKRRLENAKAVYKYL
ncbi:MAG: hypothetical protein IKF71_04820 [Bacilli bacterium]|nr:hypothetical protein [Bacilli bacterium]